MEFPCGDSYNPKKSVWCKSLAERNFNTNGFDCDHYAKCMGMVEDEICNCLSQKPMRIVKIQKPAQEELVKEFVTKDIPEFAEAV